MFRRKLSLKDGEWGDFTKSLEENVDIMVSKLEAMDGVKVVKKETKDGFKVKVRLLDK